jgi:hypothetical protein
MGELHQLLTIKEMAARSTDQPTYRINSHSKAVLSKPIQRPIFGLLSKLAEDYNRIVKSHVEPK